MKALVAGTGFAGQGHVDAFRAAGADIGGIVGRTDHVVHEVAEKLKVPYASTDWASPQKSNVSRISTWNVRYRLVGLIARRMVVVVSTTTLPIPCQLLRQLLARPS